MVNFCAIVPFYDDYDAGINLLQRLTEMGVPSIWADGPFTEYYDLHGGSTQSTDGLREAIQKEPNAILIDSNVCYVQDKWNMLLTEAGKQGFQYAFLFGCDELPEGSFEKCVAKIPHSDKPMVYRLYMEEKGNNEGEQFKDHSGPKERIFYRPEGIEVRQLHWAFFDKTVKDAYPIVTTKAPIPHLKFIHNNTVRPKERDKRMQEYQKVRVPGEYRRSRKVIYDVYKSEQITAKLLETLYPDCTITEKTRYNGTKAYVIYGSDDQTPLDDYCSYVKLPFTDGSGLYITKSRIDIKADHQNTSHN